QADAGEEDQRGKVERGRVPLVDHPVQELEVAGKDVVDLEDDRSEEENQEPVIHGGMDDARPRVTQQGLHAKPGIQVPDPLSPATAPGLVSPQRPTAGTHGKEMEHEPDEAGDAQIEDDLDRGWDVAEHFATHLVHRMFRDGPQDSQPQSSQSEEDTQPFQDL